MDPHVLHPSEPSLAGDPADARKTAQPQGDTLEIIVLGTLNPRMGLARIHNSRLPSIAFCMVTSSAYSMSLPTGMPVAMRVTRTPAGLSKRAR